jgi:hypothetical protein
MAEQVRHPKPVLRAGEDWRKIEKPGRARCSRSLAEASSCSSAAGSSYNEVANTRQRHAAIHHLLADGCSVRAISAELGLARNTVRRFARTTDSEELLVNDGTGRRPSMLENYESYLRERWNAGCTDATALWQEIRGRGYPGGYSSATTWHHCAPPPPLSSRPARQYRPSPGK